jgi:hypothetical protein
MKPKQAARSGYEARVRTWEEKAMSNIVSIVPLNRPAIETDCLQQDIRLNAICVIASRTVEQ